MTLSRTNYDVIGASIQHAQKHMLARDKQNKSNLNIHEYRALNVSK